VGANFSEKGRFWTKHFDGILMSALLCQWWERILPREWDAEMLFRDVLAWE
jgi:hypothetical protein